MYETIVIIGEDVFEELPEKEKKEFHHYERYKKLYERETDEDGEWIGDACFDTWSDLTDFAGVEQPDDIDLMDVYTCCYKVFDDEEDTEYFEDLAKKAGVQGKQLKIKKANQGWYKENLGEA